ncbi:MAG TPA: bifunctional glutamate N-acetyltransferase/amino-acid acetyltransferase ArgJ, partial [Aquella sp.]|nr:bifunctional glutamate N-acetyltransferase/amino-acid acetyltransferase ArgJ [Aquella sp.]
MKSKMTFIENNICAPIGFYSSAIAAGIKKSGKLDLGLIYSKVPAVAAGVFTKNKIKAAPLVLTQTNLKNGLLQAVIVNSGNANACTGKVGKIHVKQTADKLALNLNIDPSLVAVSSTGVIGVIMPIDKIINYIPALCTDLAIDLHSQAAKAIMTTDTFIKEAAIKVQLSQGSIRIGGIAKGSGMIHPNMATMLGFFTTDADIDQEVLQQALTQVTNESFNMISVDGDSSTNDMVLIMANKMAKNKPIKSLDSLDGKLFYEALLQLSVILSKKIAQDGEGATKLIEVVVSKAKSDKQAKKVAKSVVSSSLVKAAIFGNDANWGRIACAVGYADNYINANKLKISLENLKLFSDGVPLA